MKNLHQFLPASVIAVALANPVSVDAQNVFTKENVPAIGDAPRPVKRVPSGPALIAFQGVVQEKVHLILIEREDEALFRKSFYREREKIWRKTTLLLNAGIKKGEFAPDTRMVVSTYGTTTPVDLGEWQVGFLTAAHVLRETTPHDVCITNRVITNTQHVGIPIVEVSSVSLNGKEGYVQFPTIQDGKAIMAQMPHTMRYRFYERTISARVMQFVGGSSGAPVFAENPKNPREVGIVSIFPGGDLLEWAYIARLPKNEVLIQLKAEALAASKKSWKYTVCQ